MSRREEIKQKELLQAKFQHLVESTNKKIAGWLGKSEIKPKKTDFVNFPVIELGKSLSTLNANQQMGDFLQLKNDSGAMKSLMNKLRADQRKKTQNHLKNQVHKPQKSGKPGKFGQKPQRPGSTKQRMATKSSGSVRTQELDLELDLEIDERQVKKKSARLMV